MARAVLLLWSFGVSVLFPRRGVVVAGWVGDAGTGRVWRTDVGEGI